MTVCFLILAHDRPELCARLALRLLEQGASVCLHVDRKAGDGYFDDVDEILGDRADDVMRAERVDVRWGEWSMVQATLNGLRAIADSALEPDYVYLLSGADYPIRPLAELETFLRAHAGREFIESVDAHRERWVTRGLQVDRFRYRHWISWKTHPRLFDLQLGLQRLFRLRRAFPKGLRPHLGSQWWTLTWRTCRAILDLADDPALIRFFRRTWVPDELFFQTLVRRVVSESDRVDGRHLTLYRFNGYGTPLVYYDDHADHLAGQPFFFARKLSPHAGRLRNALDRMNSDPGARAPIPDHEVGRHTRAYERFLDRPGRGLPGVRCMLRVVDEWRGDLEWNALPYFVLVSESRAMLDQAQAHLRAMPDIVCHGELMASERIPFADGASRCAGYGAGDTAIRNQKPQNFVSDLVQDAPDSLVGYLLDPRNLGAWAKRLSDDLDIGILEVHARDPNCSILVLESPQSPSTHADDGAGDDAADRDGDDAPPASGNLPRHVKPTESGARIERLVCVPADTEALGLGLATFMQPLLEDLSKARSVSDDPAQQIEYRRTGGPRRRDPAALEGEWSPIPS